MLARLATAAALIALAGCAGLEPAGRNAQRAPSPVASAPAPRATPPAPAPAQTSPPASTQQQSPAPVSNGAAKRARKRAIECSGVITIALHIVERAPSQLHPAQHGRAPRRRSRLEPMRNASAERVRFRSDAAAADDARGILLNLSWYDGPR